MSPYVDASCYPHDDRGFNIYSIYSSHSHRFHIRNRCRLRFLCHTPRELDFTLSLSLLLLIICHCIEDQGLVMCHCTEDRSRHVPLHRGQGSRRVPLHRGQGSRVSSLSSCATAQRTSLISPLTWATLSLSHSHTRPLRKKGRMVI